MCSVLKCAVGMAGKPRKGATAKPAAAKPAATAVESSSVSPFAIQAVCAVIGALVAAVYTNVPADPSVAASVAGEGSGASDPGDYGGPRAFTPLMRLAAMGDLPGMQRFLAQGTEPELGHVLNTQTEDGQSCLHFALQVCRLGHCCHPPNRAHLHCSGAVRLDDSAAPCAGSAGADEPNAEPGPREEALGGPRERDRGAAGCRGRPDGWAPLCAMVLGLLPQHRCDEGQRCLRLPAARHPPRTCTR